MENNYISENNNASTETSKEKIFGLALSSRQKKLIHNIIFHIMLPVLISVLFLALGIHSMKENYEIAEQNTYNTFYQTAFDFAEKQNHVSDRVSISVDGVREVSNLEVLTVDSSEFIIKDAYQNDKTVSWLEVKGTGVFTVDLSAGEFIVDSKRKYVLVKVPKPVLSKCKVSGTGKSYFNNTSILSNGSVADGVQLTQTQLSEGRIKLEDSMKQSRRFHDAAMESSIHTIESLIQQWNPNIPDLQIEVEFIENT